MSDDTERKPSIRPINFETRYVDDPHNPGHKKAEDWVTWVKIGESLGATTSEKIERLKPKPERNRPPAIEWSVIEPYYEAWKKAEEPPEIGTPLAAWPGADHALIAALKDRMVRTCEEFAEMPDHEVGKIRLRNIRHKQQTCRNFLTAQHGEAAIAAQLDERDRAIEALRAEIAEMKAAQKVPADAEPAPKRRGRPPKVEAA